MPPSSTRAAPRGRAAGNNPQNRFERIAVELDEPGPERVPTLFLRDAARTVISTHDSPDLRFKASLNPYRGCEHGCSYCYARPSHEYLGFSAGLDFESRILVKEEAPELLARELAAPSWQPQLLGLSGVTDAYQPVERRLEVTRRCLAVLAACRNPVVIITKNALVTRDLDHLTELAAHQAVVVFLSVTTLDGELARRMEPRASHPRDRLEAVARLTAAGVPAGVMVAPVVPGLTDHEIPRIVAAAAEHGAAYTAYGLLRLPGAVAGVFGEWLERVVPERKNKVLHRLQEMRGGRLNDTQFGRRFRGEGAFAEQLRALFHNARRRAGLPASMPELSTAAFRPPAGPQLDLFR